MIFNCAICCNKIEISFIINGIAYINLHVTYLDGFVKFNNFIWNIYLYFIQ